MDSKAAAVTNARSITASLKRVHTSMSSSVTNADDAVSILLQDGAILQDTLHDHKYELKGSLQTTKQRLARIKSAETREKYSIFLSLSFFTSVVIYIIAKRTRILTLIWLAMHGLIKGKDTVSSMSRNNIIEIYKNDTAQEMKLHHDSSIIIPEHSRSEHDIMSTVATSVELAGGVHFDVEINEGKNKNDIVSVMSDEMIGINNINEKIEESGENQFNDTLHEDMDQFNTDFSNRSGHNGIENSHYDDIIQNRNHNDYTEIIDKEVIEYDNDDNVDHKTITNNKPEIENESDNFHKNGPILDDMNIEDQSAVITPDQSSSIFSNLEGDHLDIDGSNEKNDFGNNNDNLIDQVHDGDILRTEL